MESDIEMKARMMQVKVYVNGTLLCTMPKRDVDDLRHAMQRKGIEVTYE